MTRTTPLAAALAAAVFTGGLPAGAQHSLSSTIAEVNPFFGAQGFAPHSPLRSSETPPGGSAFELLDLKTGVDYVILGVCGAGCSDLGLTLTDPDGAVVAETSGDAFPILFASPAADGVFTVELAVRRCSNAQSCGWTIQTYAAAASVPASQPPWRQLTQSEALAAVKSYQAYVEAERVRRRVVGLDWHGYIRITGLAPEVFVTRLIETDGHRYQVRVDGEDPITDRSFRIQRRFFSRDLHAVTRTEPISGTGYAVEHSFALRGRLNGRPPGGCEKYYLSTRPADVLAQGLTARLNGEVYNPCIQTAAPRR